LLSCCHLPKYQNMSKWRFLQRAPLGSGQNNSEQFSPMHFITNISIRLSQSENRIWYDSTHRCFNWLPQRRRFCNKMYSLVFSILGMRLAAAEKVWPFICR
jgi:hypothetical protein